MTLPTVNLLDKELVSIIIPAYNAENFISETIRNVMEQNYAHFELIIVNDGSTDRTGEIIQEFLSDTRVKYISQSNIGCSGAKNTGLQASRGAFIQYLDADDLLSPDKIKEQVDVLKNQSVAIAVCRTVSFTSSITDPENTEIDTEFLYSTDNVLGFVLHLYGMNGKNGMIQPNAFLMTRELANRVGAFDPSVSPSPDEDGEYFCRAMLAADHIFFTPNGVNYYRKQMNSRNSLSKQASHRHAEGALRSIQLISSHLLEKENSDAVKNMMAKYYAGFIYLYSSYRDLGKLAEAEIEKLGVKEVPETGGGNFRMISRMIGFHNALRFKNLSSSVKKILKK